MPVKAMEVATTKRTHLLLCIAYDEKGEMDDAYILEEGTEKEVNESFQFIVTDEKGGLQNHEEILVVEIKESLSSARRPNA